MTTTEGPGPDAQPRAQVLDEVTGALEALTAALTDEEDLRVLLQRVCEQVTRAVPGVDAATITLLRGGEPYTPAGTSTVCVELDRDQYRLGAGPCLDAATSGRVTRVAIDAAADRWPRFAAGAAAAGMGSFLSAPIVIDGEHAGAVNCYSTDTTGFADLDEQLLELFTAAAEAGLRVFARYSHARDVAQQLQTALETRGVIEQAKGVIMAARRIPADEAFQVLVAQSQNGNIKLRDLAARLIANLLTDTSGIPPAG
ncbi:GAF and ANTAR domain-containing protein [Amycolatopsis sp. NPDC051106]|uniref:GAF and ANTAR domain-containing protein n=1 Tax=unclassified Amycolatopsis TaxID=2618356 RepID=UPI003414C64A